LKTTAVVRLAGAAENKFLVEEPMLALNVKGPKQLMVGDPASQSITVSNPGTGTAHHIAIEARISKGLEHPGGDKLSIKVGSLAPGESRMVRLPLVAVGGGEQTVAIRATSGNDLNQEAVAKVTVVAPSVKVAVEGPSLRFVGRNASYAVSVSNDGSAP